MKRWSLRAQLTLWSALLVAAVLLVVAVGAAFFLQQMQVEALDRQIRLLGAHFLAAYRESGERPGWVTPRVVERLIAETAHDSWFIEVADASGKPLYRSRSLAERSFAGAPPGISDFDLSEDGVRLGVFPADGATLYIAVDLDDLYVLSSSLVIAMALALPVVLAILFFGARWLAARALAPVGELTAAAERVTAHNLRDRLPVPATADELSRLATVLNATFDRLAAAFAQATRFSADASHEFKTPLAVARAEIERMLASPTLAAPDRECAAAVLDQLRRITRTTQTLLMLSRADAGQLGLHPGDGDLAALVRACAEDAQVLAEARGLSLKVDALETACARFDAERTTLALQNLFENAVKYNRDGGSIVVTLARENGTLAVKIANTGPGIPEKHREQLFARFFRADAPAEIPGHGLGLSLARELARAQGGDVRLAEADGGWTAFVFSVPLSGK